MGYEDFSTVASVAPALDLTTGQRSEEKPLLFLDIDGVVNLLVGQRALPKGKGSILRPVDQAAEKLQRLAEVFEVVWASDWRERGPLVWGKELGIGEEWDSLVFQGTDKLTALRAYACGRPWAWVDDRAEYSQHGMVVVPKASKGLLWGEVGLLCAFAARPKTFEPVGAA